MFQKTYVCVDFVILLLFYSIFGNLCHIEVNFSIELKILKGNVF